MGTSHTVSGSHIPCSGEMDGAKLRRRGHRGGGGGAASLAEGSLSEESRVGKANLRIQPMSWHNKAYFLSQPQSQAGSAWILPRTFLKTIQNSPRESWKSRPKRQSATFRAENLWASLSGDHLQVEEKRVGQGGWGWGGCVPEPGKGRL